MRPRRLWQLALALLLVMLAIGVPWRWWQQGEPKRQSLDALGRLNVALTSPDPSALLDCLVLPNALAGKTTAEQSEFVRKALQDEVSAEGIAILKREGRFGPLKEVFPAEADAWASQTGVNVTNCVAFRLDRADGLRAEVVLVKPAATPDNSPTAASYRIVRVNNVKQFAQTGLSTTNSPP